VVQCGVVHCGDWCGMVGHSMVWYGMVRPECYGVVQCDVVWWCMV
jgi:hypothetical protein